MSDPRKRMPLFVVPLLFGLLSFFSIISKPGFERLRAVEVVQLMASGMLFGAALVLFVQFFLGPRSS